MVVFWSMQGNIFGPGPFPPHKLFPGTIQTFARPYTHESAIFVFLERDNRQQLLMSNLFRGGRLWSLQGNTFGPDPTTPPLYALFPGAIQTFIRQNTHESVIFYLVY